VGGPEVRPNPAPKKFTLILGPTLGPLVNKSKVGKHYTHVRLPGTGLSEPIGVRVTEIPNYTVKNRCFDMY